MRVALVYETLGLSDSLSRQRALLARALLRQGVDVHFYGNVDAETVDLPDVTIHPLPRVAKGRSVRHSLEYLRFGVAATRALRRDRPLYDVIDVSGTTAWEHDVLCVHAVTVAEQRRWPQRAGRFHRAARLRARLAPLRSQKIAIARTIERLQYRPGRYQLALAVTEEVRRDLLRIHRLPPERVLVVPYPVDLEPLQASRVGALRNRLSLADDVPIALFVGHSFERKGLGEALEALAGLDSDLHLAIVGAGDADTYARLAAKLDVQSRVHFLGSTPAPEELFADATMFLLPTREDVWGIAIIEAMAAGIPVVTSDTPGARTVVEAAQAGVVVPTGDVDALRAALARLLAEPGLRDALGRRGRAAVAPFGLDAVGAAMVSHYERAIRLREGAALPGGGR
jgi:UDP-glucose:(heptosyl)LPS alpha-1,3-glucosyltransferase